MRAVTVSSSTVPASRHPVTVYLASLAPSGRRAMAGRLRTVAEVLQGEVETLPWHELRYQHVQALRSRLLERELAPSTVNLTLCAVRGVAKAAFNLGLVSADDYQRLCNVKAAKGDRLPAGRCLSAGEIAALLSACDGSPAGQRDAALIAILFSGGLRRTEAVGLCLSQYEPSTGELKVRGKGNRERLLYVRNGAAQALTDWLAVRGLEAGPLFTPVRKGGTVELRPMTAQAVYSILRKRARQANVRAFSPHDLRRTFVSELLDRGADISTVQQLAGHANVQTTARYDRRGDQAKARAVELLHVPYVGR